MSGARHKKTVIVAGDVTIDWNIAWIQRTDTSYYFWSKENLARAFRQRGGTALLADLIEEVATVLGKSKSALLTKSATVTVFCLAIRAYHVERPRG